MILATYKDLLNNQNESKVSRVQPKQHKLQHTLFVNHLA